MSPQEAADQLGIAMAVASLEERGTLPEVQQYALIAGIRFAQRHPEWAAAIASTEDIPGDELDRIVRTFPIEMTGAPQ